MENITLNMIYKELVQLRKELKIVEYAVIPTVKLSKKEFEEYSKDLEEALKGERTDFRQIKG